MNRRIETEYEVAYADNTDMTFILKHRMWYLDGRVESMVSTEVVGFYFGKPDSKSTMQFIGKLKATFEEE